MSAFAGASKWILPALILGVPWYAHLRGVKVYEKFTEGAGQAFETGVRIMPYLVAMLVAVAVFRVSGALDLLTRLIGPLVRAVGFPPELLTLVIVRPLSGNGALGVLAEVLRSQGADSFAGRLASTLVGSTETTFYVLTVYFGAVGVKRFRYAVTLGLIADFSATVAALILCRLAFPAG